VDLTIASGLLLSGEMTPHKSVRPSGVASLCEELV
jgi:hypothetical protein